ncbi:MAG TPA: glycosyltransferase [Pyrinomonadaceae bacterium]|nr:glycosyltransferase [Pyrinomonadaceae bacterium]
MTKPAPVSVVVPAYNAERFIALALESAFAQTLPVAEVVVVDDGSTDRTFDVARRFDVRVIRQPNGGLSAARNAGIRAATQPWVAFMDADDLWAGNKIERQFEAVASCPEAAMVCCDYYRVDDAGETAGLPQIDPLPRRPFFDAHGTPVGQSVTLFKQVAGDMLTYFFPLPSTVIVRRDTILSVGLFDEGLRRVEDMECFLRVLSGRGLAVVEEPLVYYRQHESSLTHNVMEMHRALGDVHRMVTERPDRYVPDTADALKNYWRHSAVEAGRKLLAREQYAEARELLGEALSKGYSRRAGILYAFSYCPRPLFDCALRTKRLLVRKKIISEVMEFRLAKALARVRPKSGPLVNAGRVSAEQIPPPTGD